MTPRVFSLITATLFSLIALLHVLRLLRGWQVTIGNVVVPLWVSWIGLAIAGYLAYQGVKLSRPRMKERHYHNKLSILSTKPWFSGS